MRRSDDDHVSRETIQFDRKAAASLARLDETSPRQHFEEQVSTFESGLYRAPYQKLFRSFQSLPDSGRPLRILDYGCGQGVHTVRLQQLRPRDEITGIDLSEPSLDVAGRIARDVLSGAVPRFVRMDAHQLEFPGGTFDVVTDFGTFSSLDFDRAVGELSRVLRPGGHLLAVETLGHNPILNLWRRVSVLRGRRTQWAARHILRLQHLRRLEKHFQRVEASFFSFFTLFSSIPILAGERSLSILERLDRRLLTGLPILGRYAFKIVIQATR